jgi:5-methylthioadenosine/S-adenosylhomocysteine deaminase
MADLILSNATIVPTANEAEILSPGYIAITAQQIATVGAGSPAAGVVEGARTVDLSGRVILPGFITGHMHQRPVRALGDGLSFHDWHERVDGATHRMSPDDARAGALLGFADCLRAGITSTLAYTIYPEAEAQAAREVGIRARIVPYIHDPAGVAPYREILERQGGSEADRVRFWGGVSNASHMPLEVLRPLGRVVRERGLGFHTHHSETQRDEIQVLAEAELLGPSLSLAHCVRVTPNDIEILAAHGVHVIHNPKSNLHLATGVAPIPEMLAAGINVGLGTDGMVSTYRLDIFEEMRTAAMIQRGTRRDPAALSSAQVLDMATAGAARALMLGGQLGQLKPGLKADLIVLDARKLWWTPRVDDPGNSNLLSLIVWSAVAADVEMVLVDGQIVVENGHLATMDEDEIRLNAQRVGERIIRDGRLARPA